eukprot:gnl/TRDRNA2_/TRDRNA2_124708_c2_seq1.p1 gnl/TRDRNA2_/TRDRNA2_124708_c2~~gnl/TRDRNA2_/TRDRNA2_124708_c2_seq1.p1  ORF type:complete len:192 (+),score=8.02 gnl/TRDRNA2_/TRDRNA2_124708_c2_seq1:74-577(+)
MHVDAIAGHAYGMLVHVYEQNVSTPWPFDFVTHAGKRERITTDPGGREAILYEAAACEHGRDTPFDGDEFALVYIAFRTAGWNDLVLQTQQVYPDNPYGTNVFKGDEASLRRQQSNCNMSKDGGYLPHPLENAARVELLENKVHVHLASNASCSPWGQLTPWTSEGL